MNHYEILTLFSAKFSEEEIVPVASRVTKLVGDLGGQVTKEEHLGRRRLAYPIDHAKQGYYEFVQFELDAEKMASLERSLRLDQDVIRHQVIKLTVRRPEVVAAELALQEKLRSKRLAETQAAEAKPAPPEPVEPVKPQTEAERQASLKALDEKLEEILTQDIVK